MRKFLLDFITQMLQLVHVTPSVGFIFWRRSMKTIPRGSKTTDATMLPANGTVFVFFGADSPLSVTKHLIEASLRRCFYSIVSRCDTHLAHNFQKFKFSVNTRYTPLFECLQCLFAQFKLTTIQYHFVYFLGSFWHGHLNWLTTATFVFATRFLIIVNE